MDGRCCDSAVWPAALSFTVRTHSARVNNDIGMKKKKKTLNKRRRRKTSMISLYWSDEDSGWLTPWPTETLSRACFGKNKQQKKVLKSPKLKNADHHFYYQQLHRCWKPSSTSWYHQEFLFFVHLFMFRAHQACRHPGVPATEPGLPAEILTQRETTHTAATTQTLCREDTHIKP